MIIGFMCLTSHLPLTPHHTPGTPGSFDPSWKQFVVWNNFRTTIAGAFFGPDSSFSPIYRNNEAARGGGRRKGAFRPEKRRKLKRNEAKWTSEERSDCIKENDFTRAADVLTLRARLHFRNKHLGHCPHWQQKRSRRGPANIKAFRDLKA